MDEALLGDVRARLGRLNGTGLEAPGLADEAVALAGQLLALARSERRRAEAAAEARLARLMEDEAGRLFTLAFTDQALRAKRPERVAEQLRHLLSLHGVPRYFSAWERVQLRAFKTLGGAFPRWLVPKVLARLRYEVRRVSLPAADPELAKALAERAASGIRVNLNHLGEAILGEDEARARHAVYLRTLARPDIESVSVKVSSIASQINLLAWDETLAVLEERVAEMYRVALRHPISDAAGVRPKLVMLDMEEYRDLELTVALFERLLAHDEFNTARAGIVLQAYLPDSHPVQRRLVALATRRVAAGGKPIHIRLVKGANLALERVDASLHGWAQAPYRTKADVDANYKRLVAYGLGHAHVASIGVASHNLFDLAWAMVLRAARGNPEGVGFEMLEGIAAPLARVVQAVTGTLMVYAPTADDRDLLAAIAYLIRRLDENTGPDNFLRASFGMEVGSGAFEGERDRFLAAVRDRDVVSQGPRRTVREAFARMAEPGLEASARMAEPGLRASARMAEPGLEAPVATVGAAFENEPDTDWSLPAARSWIAAELARLQSTPPGRVVAQVGGAALEGEIWADGVDPSRPGAVPYQWMQATIAQADLAVTTAHAAVAGWQAAGIAARQSLLTACAQALRGARGELVALMVSDAGKAIPEGDAEVSEAIDFAEYYARGLDEWPRLIAEGLDLSARGVVLVTPPWNFPLAIPAGGVFAALAAGNTVIMKPPPETPRVAEALCRLCWDAGVPRTVLQFVPCANEPVGTHLVSHPRVDAVVLTGSTATARRFLALREDRDEATLIAETGGKNAMIITEMADHDLAVKHALHSAFGHAGQKCSATSLLIVEAALYDDDGFMQRLADATRSLPVGSAWRPEAKVTPLIREPRGDLAWALTSLEPGESWLVAPVAYTNPRLWSPGVKLGVKVGSRTYNNELFGPVLGVMRADDLDHALAIANGVAYGLTAGIQSLDDREIARWVAAMDAGCLYVNRATTGAIVLRQPFGGRKASVFGPGAKAGGPNYVLQLARVSEPDNPRVPDYAAAYAAHFAQGNDPMRLLGQDNILRYQPLRGIVLRLGREAREHDADRVVLAAVTCGTPLVVSAADAMTELPWVRRLGAVVETSVAMLTRPAIERVRVVGTVEPGLAKQCHERGVHLASEPVVSVGRVELLHYLKEQTVSHDYHRFGNLGVREGEPRAPLR